MRHSEQVEFGRGGLYVSRLGVGTAPLGGLFSAVHDSEVDSIVSRGAELGLTYFDTAPLYGNGSSERRVGKALGKVPRGSFRISTKVGMLLLPGVSNQSSAYVDVDPFTLLFDYTPKGVRRSLEESLSRLRLESVDMLYIHDPDNHLDQAIDEAYPELSKIRDEGLVTSIGVGTNSAKVGARFLRETDIDIAMVAGRYTLLDQVALEDFLPEALKRQVSVMGAGVFNSGVVLDPIPGATYNYETAPPEVISRAQKIHDVIKPYGVSPAAVALQFPLRHPAIRACLVGVRTVQELEGNIEAFNSSLPDELFSDLESAGLIGPIQS